jgi:4-amino-4-deoxy-L-arabinose transferase-like glycosyltransferase
MVDLKIIDLTPFRRTFWNFFAFTVIMAAGTILAGLAGFRLIADVLFQSRIRSGLLYAIIIITALATIFLSREKTRMIRQENFDEKVISYLRYYRLKASWGLISVFISCIFYLLAATNFFLYYILFELLMLLIFYPTGSLLKRELKDEELLVKE